MLAIIIPYYKLTYFEATLKSLANQSDKRFKVYIGDDASPEDCTALLQKFEGQFDFIYHRFETNLGGTSLTQQWERCIALSDDEEWLLILGDDDVLGENVVAEFYYNVLEICKSEISVIRFSSVFIDEKGRSISKKYCFPKTENAVDSFLNHYLEITRSSLSEHIFNREKYKKHKFTNYPLAWYSDDKAWLDFSDCNKIYTINEGEVKIRISSQNISGKNDNIFLKRKAGWEFIKDIVNTKFTKFTNAQKNSLLFRYGELQVEFSNIRCEEVFYIWFHFVKNGFIYDSFRYLRRIYKALKKNK